MTKSAPGSTEVALPAWPPAFTEAQLCALASASTDYALAHGLVYRPLPASSGAAGSGAATGPPTDSVIHAPFSLLPSPFPRDLFERAHGPILAGGSQGTEDAARAAHSLPALYAYVYARITTDHAFLERVIGANVAQVDEFQGELWKRYLAVREELLAGQAEVAPTAPVGHRLHLGLFRSDYLLHAPDEDPDHAEAGAREGKRRTLELKQVEFNTISASFGSLSTRSGELHRFLHTSTGAFFGAAPGLLGDASRLPPNRALSTLAAGLAAGHRSYLDAEVVPRAQRTSARTAQPMVLFVVQPGERNAFDQRWLEYELASTHGIRVLRATFDELAGSVAQALAGAGPFGATLVGERKILRVRLPGHHEATASSDNAGDEISVVYFRAGYGPGDYPEGGKAWEIRSLLERSAAIKCPTIALQLAGAKKVQQVLAEPGVLESFLLAKGVETVDPSEFAGWEDEAAALSKIIYTQHDVNLLRSTFSGLWPLDSRSELGLEGIRLAHAEPERFVLKPQREGGGNNIYRQDIPPFLSKLGSGGEEGYILMELIKPPRGVGNYLMRAGAGNEDGPKLAGDVVSELGIYSTALFGPKRAASQSMASSASSSTQSAPALDMVHEGYGGYLLRTKGRESDEGGVAVGYSVIDSVLLV